MSKPKLGIIAGSGDLPCQIAEWAVKEGRDVFVIGILGFIETQMLQTFDCEVISIGEVGKQLKALKKANVQEVCFAGIVKRPDFKTIKLDTKGVMLLPKVIQAASKGDDALLTLLVNVIEKEGFKVVGADSVFQNLVAKVGPIGRIEPTEKDLEDIRKAALVANEMGRLDIGQGAIVCDGLVLAVEAQEGTDQMLERCASLPIEIRGSINSRRGVLVKRPKPDQERRIDLPTIGLNTIKRASDAGLAGIAIEAGGALILDRDEMLEYAEAHNMWLYSFPKEGFE